MAVDQRLNAMIVAEGLLEDYQHAYDVWSELDALPIHPSDVEETIICLRCNEALGVYEKLRDRIIYLLTAGIEADRKEQDA